MQIKWPPSSSTPVLQDSQSETGCLHRGPSPGRHRQHAVHFHSSPTCSRSSGSSGRRSPVPLRSLPHHRPVPESSADGSVTLAVRIHAATTLPTTGFGNSVRPKPRVLRCFARGRRSERAFWRVPRAETRVLTRFRTTKLEKRVPEVRVRAGRAESSNPDICTNSV